MFSTLVVILSLIGDNAPRASWYESGTTLANGEQFKPDEMIIAHKSLPFGTRVQVTNLENGKQAEGVVKDRGPFIKGRDWDLSRGMAKRLDFIDEGVIPVNVEILE